MAGFAGNDLAGVHADANRDRHAAVAFELLVEFDEYVPHVDSSAHGADGVVLVESRDPEHRHDGIADVLLDGSSVPLDRLAHRVEVA